MKKMDFDLLLLAENPNAVFITTASGLVVHWSSSAEQAFGHSQEYAMGQQLEQLIASPCPANKAHAFPEHDVQPCFARLECVQRCKDVALADVGISSVAKRGSDGEIAYIIVDKEGVAQQRLQHDAGWVESNFHDLLEHMPDAIVIANGTGQIVSVNRHAEMLFDYPSGALCGKAIELLLPERLRASHPEHRVQYFSQPSCSPIGAGQGLFGRRRDGSEFPAEIRLSPLKTDGELLMMSVIRDISERITLAHARELEQAQSGTQQALRRFQQMWEATTDAVFLVDENSQVRYANPVVKEMFGYSAEDLLGRSISILTPARFQEAHEHGLARYVATKTRNVEWRGREEVALHRDGHEFPVEISYCYLESDSEPLFAGVVRDISVRKSVEAMLAESQRRFRDMLDGVQLISLMLDSQARVTYCNDYMLIDWLAA